MFLSTRKKATLITLGLVLIIGLGIFGWQVKQGNLFSKAATISGQTFSDVPLDYWAYLQIEAAYRGGVVQGYPDGTFRPEVVVTHDQITVFIARAMAGGDAKVPIPAEGQQTYSNIPPDHWAYKHIEYLISKKILKCVPPGGKPKCTFEASLEVNRALMSIYLARAIAGGTDKVPAGPATPTFSDVSTSTPAYKFIEYLYSLGVVQGYPDGKFRPANIITRAQMAVFITRGFDLISTALVANVSGKVKDSTGTPLANAYLVFDQGEAIVQTNANGNYSISDLDATITEVEIFDQDGNQYESPDLNKHLMILDYGQQTVNFTGLIKK